jgi:hypothetical protein
LLLLLLQMEEEAITEPSVVGASLIRKSDLTVRRASKSFVASQLGGVDKVCIFV